MRKTLNNSALEAQFRNQGYVQVPFISPEEVAQLTQLFFDTLPQSGGQITADETGVENSRMITYDFTFIDKNPEYKQKVFNIITRFFKPQMDALLENYKPIIANYIRKQTDTGEVPLHQNWAFADERKCTTVSIWCPLVDSTIENGTLQVVPGSHKRFGEVRGPMIPWELDDIKKEIIDHYLVPLETPAGHCVILDDSIVHYSAINKTKDLRLAIQLICIPTEFPSWHYNMNPEISSSKVDILEVDEAFYIQFNPWKKVEGAKLVKTRPYRHRNITINEFKNRMKNRAFDEPPRLFFYEKLKSIMQA
jgi:hypothetical protein